MFPFRLRVYSSVCVCVCIGGGYEGLKGFGEK